MDWTGRSQEWLLDHGFKTDDAGKVLIPQSKWRNLAGTGTSIRNPEQRTICIPTDHGLALYFEHKHFQITRG